MLTGEQKKILRAFDINTHNIFTWDSLPVSNKEHIRKAPIPATFNELRITSGSTGEPLYVFYSKEAVESFMRRTVTSLRKSGLLKKDIILNLFAYGNYIPGSMYERACQREGLAVMPLGAPNTYPKEKMVEAIIKVKPTVWLSVPSYALTLLELLAKKKKKNYFPRKVIVAGERLLDTHIKRFQNYNVELVNHFGLTECPAIGVSKKGDPRVLEIINDGIFTESLKENDAERFVVTDLHNTATPIVRYKTGDMLERVRHNSDGTLSQMSIVGRGDDLVKIQGILIPKTKIIEIVSRFTDKFLVDIQTKKARDFVEVTLDRACKKNQKKIEDSLAFFKKWKISFKKHFSIPTTSSFKNRYVIDSRR